MWKMSRPFILQFSYIKKALAQMGMPAAAVQVFSSIMRKTNGRFKELMNAIRYERALAYQSMGQHAKYRAKLQKLYSEDPSYEDVAERLRAR